MKTLIQLLIVTLCCSACSTNAPPVTSALESGHWRKVKNKPPTYFPIGVREDHRTDFHHGYLIESGNANGTRFFVPMRNTKWPREDLIDEAQAAMTPQAKKELKAKQAQGRRMDAASAGVGGFLHVILGLFGIKT